MREGGRPDPGKRKPVALVERAAALVGLVVAVVQPVSGATQPEVVGAFAVALAIVDLVGPGVRGQRLEPVAEALVHLHGQTVVIAVDAVFGIGDGAVAGIGTLAGHDRHGVRARRAAARTVDGVREVRGSGRHIEIAHAVQFDAAAPDVGNVHGDIGRKLALDSDVALLRIGRFQVGSQHLYARGRNAAARRNRCQGIREHRTGGQLRRLRGRQRDAGLVHPVARGEQVVERPALETGVEHSITGLEDGLVVQLVGGADARRQVGVRGRNVARQGIILVADAGLRQLRVFVARAVVHGQLRSDAPLVLQVEAKVVHAVVYGGLAERLRVALPVLGAGGIAAVVQRERVDRLVRVAPEEVADIKDVVLGGRDIDAELEGVSALGPGGVVLELEAELAGLDPRQVGGRPELGAVRGDL